MTKHNGEPCITTYPANFSPVPDTTDTTFGFMVAQ